MVSVWTTSIVEAATPWAFSVVNHAACQQWNRWRNTSSAFLLGLSKLVVQVDRGRARANGVAKRSFAGETEGKTLGIAAGVGRIGTRVAKLRGLALTWKCSTQMRPEFACR